MTPGIYPGLSRAEYDAIPALRSSTAFKFMTLPPAKASLETEKTRPMDFGTCAHDLMLERKERFVVSPFSDYRKKVAREWRDANADRLVMKKSEAVKLRTMHIEGRRQIWEMEHPFPLFAANKGEPELTIVWNDVSGIKCKMRLDWSILEDGAIFDYKTTAESGPEDWVRRKLWHGPAFSMAFYLRGLVHMVPKNFEWRWIVQETDDPFLVFGVAACPHMIKTAGEQVDEAIAKFIASKEPGANQGYSKRAYWTDTPSWIIAQADERQARKEMEGE